MGFTKVTKIDFQGEYIRKAGLDLLSVFDDPRAIRTAYTFATALTNGPLLDTNFKPLNINDVKAFFNMHDRSYNFFDGEYFYKIPIATVSGEDDRVFRRKADFAKDFADSRIPVETIAAKTLKNAYYTMRNHVVKKQTGYEFEIKWEEGNYAHLDRDFMLEVIHDTLSQFSTEA